MKETFTVAPGQNGDPEIVFVVMVVVSPNVKSLKVETIEEVTVPDDAEPVVFVLPALVHDEPLQLATLSPLRSGNASRKFH